MSVKIAIIKDNEIIDDFLKNKPISNLYHDYRWGKIIENCFGINIMLCFPKISTVKSTEFFLLYI